MVSVGGGHRPGGMGRKFVRALQPIMIEILIRVLPPVSEAAMTSICTRAGAAEACTVTSQAAADVSTDSEVD